MQTNPESAAVIESANARFWPRIDKSGDCWLWTGSVNSHGYGHISIAGSHHFKCHRLAWTLTFGYIPAGAQVLHKPILRQRPDSTPIGQPRSTMNDKALPALVDEALTYFAKAGDDGDRRYVEAIRQHIAALSQTAGVEVVAYLIDGRVEQGLAFDKQAAEDMAFANAGTVVPLARADAISLPAGLPKGWHVERVTGDAYLYVLRTPTGLEWIVEPHERLHVLLTALLAAAPAASGGECPAGVECARTNPELHRCMREAEAQFPAASVSERARELVRRWRGARTVLIESQRVAYESCADELESLLGRGGHG